MYSVSDVCLNGGITRETAGAAMPLMIVESEKDLRKNFIIALIFKFFQMSAEQHQSLVGKYFEIRFQIFPMNKFHFDLSLSDIFFSLMNDLLTISSRLHPQQPQLELQLRSLKGALVDIGLNLILGSVFKSKMTIFLTYLI